MVGRNSARLRALRFCASSTQAIRNPSSDLIEFGGVILHTPEDDEAVAGRLDLVVEYLEPMAKAERGDLAFDQPLGRLRQRPLRLANADRERAALGLAGLDQKLAEEMRFSRAAPAIARPCSARAAAAAQRLWLSEFSGWTMTRSILWISSRAPSSPVSIACVALPQPRSRMALAAETRAAAVASFDRMTPRRTFNAVPGVTARERADFRDCLSHLRSRKSFPHRDRDQAHQ